MKMSADRLLPGLAPRWGRVDPYRFFAYSLSSPSQDRYALISNPEFRVCLGELGAAWGCGEDPCRSADFGDYREYESSYLALFEVGVPGPPIPLQESGYRKDMPPQDLVLENVLFYDVLNLKPDTSKSAPDHIVPQLEFLSAAAYLGENAAGTAAAEGLLRLELDFLERHQLSWIPALRDRLFEVRPPFFPELVGVLSGYLVKRMDVLRRAAGTARCRKLSIRSEEA